MLGPAGSLDGFDTFWEAAAEVCADLVQPAGYAHHCLGDPEQLRTMMVGCDWTVDSITPVTSVRRCGASELWRWLWGSLPLLRQNDSFMSQEERQVVEGEVRAAFFRSAERFRTGDIYTVRSLAHLACATAASDGFVGARPRSLP